MKLVTFQSLDAVKDLFEKGYLECNRSKIDIKKAGVLTSISQLSHCTNV